MERGNIAVGRQRAGEREEKGDEGVRVGRHRKGLGVADERGPGHWHGSWQAGVCRVRTQWAAAYAKDAAGRPLPQWGQHMLASQDSGARSHCS